MPSISIGFSTMFDLIPAVSQILTVHPDTFIKLSITSRVVPLIGETIDKSRLPVQFNFIIKMICKQNNCEKLT